MTKLKSDPIGSPELIEFLETTSDFAFELRCLERLSTLKFRCQHGGSYTDRVTNKPRQFDIRAFGENGPLRIRCAIECKNLQRSFPLLVMCAPRTRAESFHDLVISFDPDRAKPRKQFDLDAQIIRKNCHAVRVDSPISNYALDDPVGKSLAQVGKSRDGAISSNDAEVFEKWSQALASAHDLADEATEDGEREDAMFMSLILPILVVPEGTLWKVDYTSNGTRTGSPTTVDRCSFFIGRDYFAGEKMHGTNVTLSHLEFDAIGPREPTRQYLGLRQFVVSIALIDFDSVIDRKVI